MLYTLIQDYKQFKKKKKKLITGFYLGLATSEQLRIVGGKRALIEKYPYQVSIRRIRHSRSQHFCGGAIISNRHILTAAHCVNELRKKDRQFAVYTGSDDSQEGGVRRSIRKAWRHENWHFKPVDLLYDIGIIEVSIN